MTENPYSTPTVDTAPSNDGLNTPRDPTLLTLARTIFLDWERLRIIYIILMGIVTLVLAVPNRMDFGMIVTIIEGAVVANICFFAGPLVETYVRWLGHDGQWLRWFLFIGGTLLTAILAAATIATMLVPEPSS